MPDLITTERILIVQLMDGRRSRYIPPKRGIWQSIKVQIEMARRIGAKPLYSVAIHPKPGHDWALNSQLVRS
jgi:hypothetical protein